MLTLNGSPKRGTPPEPQEKRFQVLKSVVHQELVEAIDLAKLAEVDAERLESHVRRIADHVCRRRGEHLDEAEQRRLLDGVLNEAFGLGPLEGLLADPEVSDVLVNGPDTVYVERRGRLELTSVAFADEAHLLRIVQRIVGRVGRRVDESTPMVDARLPDGSRVHAVIPPLALDGTVLSIRRFGREQPQLADLLRFGTLNEGMSSFLQAAVRARVGILISGGTGAGKTTLLNALSAAIPDDERLVTIEDAAELNLPHAHCVRLETRPANAEGIGAVSTRDLLKTSLRMRPDRILVGEVRGAEVWDMLQAMNTGHEGSLTTVHANSSTDALSRLVMMVAMTGHQLPIQVVRSFLATGIRLVIQLARLRGGVRRVLQITEVAGVRKGRFVLHDVFRFEQHRLDANQTAVGEFRQTGYRPICLERFKEAGVEIPAEFAGVRPGRDGMNWNKMRAGLAHRRGAGP